MKLLDTTVSVPFKTQVMGLLQRKDTMLPKRWERIPWRLAKVDPLFCPLTQLESLSLSLNYKTNKSLWPILNSVSFKTTSTKEAILCKMTYKQTCNGVLTQLQMLLCNSSSKLFRFISNRVLLITSLNPRKVGTRATIVERSFLFFKANHKLPNIKGAKTIRTWVEIEMLMPCKDNPKNN